MRRLMCFTVILALLFAAGVYAQKTAIARQNEAIRKARAELAQIDLLKRQNRADLSASERDLTLARNRIGVQKKLVQSIESQIVTLSRQIAADSTQVGRLATQLTTLRSDYARWVRAAWRGQKLNDAAAFLMASKDFNDATRRLNFIRRSNRARADKGAQIESLATSLGAKIDSLAALRADLGGLKRERNGELRELADSEKRYAETISSLKGDQKSLDEKAKKERDKIAAAQRQINKIVAEQARAEKARAAKQGGLSASEAALSGRFEENKGRLPWPVGGPGTVLHHFGTQKMGEGIVFRFDGIFIAANPGAVIGSIFGGKVTKIYNVDQFGAFVIVRAGHYMVVYGNLGDVSVAVGQQISAGQQVGRLVSTFDVDRQKLMFQIWNETTPLDPEEWLRR